MPELGRYKKLPRPESFTFFENRLNDLPCVTNFKRRDEQVYEIQRQGMDKLILFLTNVYIVGEADVYEIMEKNKGINAIVTVSNWNSYSDGAKKLARDNNIGLFRIREFEGAIHYNGKQYLDYQTPERNTRKF